MSYKAKRIAIAVAAAVALFTAASVGTYFYIKGNESAQATENTEQVSEQSNNSNTQIPENNNNPETTENTQNNEQPSAQDNGGAQANAGTNNRENTTTTTTNEDGTTTRRTANNDGTTTTVTTNPDGTATTTVTNPDGTVISQTTDANVVTEYEEEERLVSKDDWVGWRPEAVPVPAVARIAKDLGVNKYKLNVIKEVISKDSNEDGKYELGEAINYKITVSNVGNIKLSNLKISDKVNDREYITKMSRVNENNTLIQEVESVSNYTFDLDAGDKTYFEYIYNVKEEDIYKGTVQNIVTVENDKVQEKDSKEVPTADISKDFEIKKSTKSKPDNSKFYVLGEKIIYDVEIINSGNLTLDIKVKDPISEEEEQDINIKPGETKNLEFTHIVTEEDVNATKVVNVATGEIENEEPRPSNPQEDPVNEYININVEKIWDDNNNQDGYRPEEINVQLLVNGNEKDEPVSLNETNNWKYVWTDLVKRENGEAIDYTIKEIAVDKYETQITGNQAEGFKIINTHIPETTSLTGIKIWKDNDNQDGKRPSSVKIILNKQVENGEIQEAKSQTISSEDNWTYKFEDIPVYESGKMITYSISEEPIQGYVMQIDGDNIVNTHIPETINISGIKTWEDNNNQDGRRPESIKIILSKTIEGKTTLATTKIVTPDENEIWSYKFDNLPVYEKGKKIEYSINEEKVPEYETKIEDYNITNTHIPETITMEGEKTWVDADNQDGIRPQIITVKLLKGEDDNKVEVSNQDISSDSQGKWIYKFENLPKYEKGKEIKYSIEENAVEGYKQQIVGNNITNTHIPEKLTINGEKIWEDNNNQDGKRPEYITIKLYKEIENNKTLITSKQISPNSEGKWLYSFEDLPKYEKGKEINYTLEELNVDGYTQSFNGYNLINTHNSETTSISAKKIWDDKDNLLKLRPDGVDFYLVIDGVRSNQKLTANNDNNWQVSFDNLNKYKDQGNAIRYSIVEDKITGYKEPTYGTENRTITITNTIDYPSVNIEKNAEKIKAVSGNNFEDILKDEQGNITTKINNVGDVIKYEIIAENDGTQVLNNVNIIDQNHNVKVLKITKGIDVYENTGKEENITAGNNLLSYLPDGVEYKLEPNEKYIIEIQYVVDNINNISTLDNTAKITARADNEDVNDDDDEKIPVTQVINNSIEKTAVKVGNTQITDENREKIKLKKDDVITYEIMVSNLGNVDLTNVKVTDDHNVTVTKIEKLNKDGSRINQSNLIRTATAENLLGKEILEADSTYIITVTYTVPDNNIDEEAEDGDKIINKATITTNELPEKSDDDTLQKNKEAIITQEKESSVVGKTGDNTIYAGDIIEYTITVSNKGNISGSTTVKDSDLRDNINNDKITMMNGETELNKTASLTTKCITVSSNKAATTISVNELANGFAIPSIDNGETIVIKFKVKVGKLLPGETIVNRLADQENTHTQNDIEASIILNKELLKPQNVVLVIDLSLSMAEDVNYHGKEDPMADTYQKTRWYALTQALDKFLNTYMKDGNPAGNTVTIIGYNNEAKDALVTNTTSLSAAKAAYANVFTEAQYNMITGEDKNDVDNLTARNTGTLLGSGTNIQDGLRKASNTIGNNTQGSKVILMTDGEANRSLDEKGNPTGSGDHVERAISEATALKNKGITLYTVALSVGVENETYTNRLINMASEDENGNKLAKSAEDMQSLVDYFENVSEFLSELHITGITEDGILHLSDSISIDSRYVKNVEVTIPNDDGIEQPITMSWSQFTNYYSATAKTINIKQLASDNQVKGITGAVTIDINVDSTL